MPEVSAALARVQLGKLDEIVRARRRIASLYDEGLAELERKGTLRVVRPRAPQCVSALPRPSPYTGRPTRHRAPQLRDVKAIQLEYENLHLPQL